MTRTDIHRPSAIDPEAYEFVAVGYDKTDSIDEVYSLAEHQKTLRAHITATGGKYSSHEHGGNCDICGAANIYYAVFWHPDSQKYIRIGLDCAEKLLNCNPADFRAFRKDIDDARQRKAGKSKAQAILTDAGLARAWQIHTAEPDELAAIGATSEVSCRYHGCPECDYTGGHRDDCSRPEYELREGTRPESTREFRTLRDIIGNIVKYGNASEPQLAYLAKLIDQIDHKAARDRERKEQRETEHAAAVDCPTGRLVLTGSPVSVKRYEGQYGVVVKWLFRSDDGFKVFGTIPTSILDELHDAHAIIWPRDDYEDRGRFAPDMTIQATFTAAVTPSDDDAKFGFYKRPTKATCQITEPVPS